MANRTVEQLLQALGFDDTSKVAVSLHGKDVAAGDTAVRVDADGDLQLDILSSVLPTGAATAANQATANAALAAIQAAVELIDNMIAGNQARVDVVTSALPTGAATATNQSTVIGDLNAINSLAGAVETVPTQFTKTVTVSGTPEALAADGTFFRKAILIGKKAGRTNNGGVVYLGIGPANETQALEITPGAVWSISAPAGEKYDLNDWYLDVENNGDGVVVIYS